MQRHQLEDRIRTSLQARADDVVPTPQLWERVATRTARRARWRLGAWVASGVTAVVALVVGGVVLLGSPQGVQIDPRPDVAETPDQPGPGTGQPGAPTVVTTDGSSLFRVDPTTGEVVDALSPFEGFGEGVAIREVAVRPVSDEGDVTVAMVIEVEGGYDVEVATFDAGGQRVDRLRVGMAAPVASDLPPDLVWSDDGRYLMWAGTRVVDGSTLGPALWAYDWVDRPVDEAGQGEVAAATPRGADGALFEGSGTVDLREWRGRSDGPSTVVATTPTGGAHRIDLTPVPGDCGQATSCPPTFDVVLTDLGFEGMSAIDLGTLDTGVSLALVARPGPPGDAEGATLALVAEPMSDQQRELPIPQLTSGTASPPDGWMAVAGDRVALGFGGQATYLLTVTGDLVEQVEVTETVALPDGTQAADLAMLEVAAPADDATPATPTPDPTDDDAVIGQDGVPTHVVAIGPGGSDLRLVDRRSPDRPLATWDRPEGVDGEMAPVDVVVHPASTPQDLEVVTRWAIGESDVLARTVVRDGQVVANASFDAPLQPDSRGGAAETADAAPVFSPGGDWLAWVETPDGGAGPAQVRIVTWTEQGPTGPTTVVTAPGGETRPRGLADWASSPQGDILTMTSATAAGPASPAPAGMVELRLDVAGGTIADPAPEDWRVVALPGVLFDAGSFRFEDRSERYIVFDGGEDVLYGLAASPETAVPTGAFAFSEGRVVAFGPDSALVQRADGAWQRVQVDTGAASPVEVPDGTQAVLPWSPVAPG